MKQAFIFDMDGVLIDSEPLWEQAGLNIIRKHGIPITEEELAQTRGLPSNRVLRFAAELYNVPLNIDKVTQELLDSAINNIIAAKPLMSGVKETLELLATNNIKLAIASASPRYMLESIVQSCGIADHFSYISSAAELEYNKPHPAVYLHAAQKLGVNPLNCVGIEDSKVGMTAVKAASMSCIAIPNKEEFNAQYWALADVKLANLFEIDSKLIKTI